MQTKTLRQVLCYMPTFLTPPLAPHLMALWHLRRPATMQAKTGPRAELQRRRKRERQGRRLGRLHG